MKPRRMGSRISNLQIKWFLSASILTQKFNRVNFIEQKDWKERSLGNFAKELGEFYINLGQLEPELIDKFETNIDSEFVDTYKK